MSSAALFRTDGMWTGMKKTMGNENSALIIDPPISFVPESTCRSIEVKVALRDNPSDPEPAAFDSNMCKLTSSDHAEDVFNALKDIKNCIKSKPANQATV